MRDFDTGATRDSAENKLHYQGYLSQRALRRFAEYMLSHEVQADGKRRQPGNWKLGIPLEVYEDSLYRHTMEFYEKLEKGNRGAAAEVAAAMFFNLQGWLHEQDKAEEEHYAKGTEEAQASADRAGEAPPILHLAAAGAPSELEDIRFTSEDKPQWRMISIDKSIKGKARAKDAAPKTTTETDPFKPRII